MCSNYEAAIFPREYELAKKFNINLIGAVTWAFEFEDQPWFIAIVILLPTVATM
ncbi:MAG: hypothetical protein ABI691_18755 [Ginsengibacter sp.]